MSRRDPWWHKAFQLERGQRVEILSTGAVHVRLLDSTNFKLFSDGKRCDGYGGQTQKKRAVLAAPSAGVWHVVFFGPAKGARFDARVVPIPLHDLVALRGTAGADTRDIDVLLKLPVVTYQTLLQIAGALDTDATGFIRDVLCSAIIVASQRLEAADAAPVE